MQFSDTYNMLLKLEAVFALKRDAAAFHLESLT